MRWQVVVEITQADGSRAKFRVDVVGRIDRALDRARAAARLAYPTGSIRVVDYAPRRGRTVS